MHVRDGHLRGGNQKIVVVGDLESVFLKFGKLSGPRHRSPVDHKRREYFGITAAGVRVQEKVDDRALELGAQADIKMKPCSGYLRGGFRVQNTEAGPDFPVGFRLEPERRRRTEAADLQVGGIVRAKRHAALRNVREIEHYQALLLFERSEFGVVEFDLFFEPVHPRHYRGDVSPVLFKDGYLAAGGVLLLLQGVRRPEQLPPAHVDGQQFVHRGVHVFAARPHRRFDPRRVFPDDFDIQHNHSPLVV
ncbi:MAG: hypothetical protein BWY37_01840 [Firmicutes bacterium ADurb.Bin262]|nr:MAG: hypothetical protein BWY37_01840 [Firmicutes bacterium ADurb.Bin262]